MNIPDDWKRNVFAERMKSPMKKWQVKRALSLLIALTLVLTSMSVPAFAVNSPESTIFTVDGIRYRILDAEQNTVEVIHSTVDEAASNIVDSTYSGAVTIPAKVTYNSTEYSVIGIDAMAFLCAKITGITLQEGLEYIDASAFAGSSLTSIVIPASVTRLGGPTIDSVFGGLGSNAAAITSITFAAGSKLTEIGASAFDFCNNVTSLEIPAGVTDMDGVLDGWTNAKNVTFAEGSPFSKGNDYVLYKDDTLLGALDNTITSVTVKDGTTAIEAGAFSACKSLSSITLPDGLDTIGREAFSQCSALTSITLPDTVTSIGFKAFDRCTSLATINLPDSLTEIGTWAFYKTALVTVVIPDGIKEIPDHAFNSVATLRTIVIPSSVASIGILAFSGLKDTTTLIMQGTTAPTFNAKAFGSKGGSGVSPEGLTVLVPSTAKRAYETALSSFKNITINTFGPTMTDVTVKANGTTTFAADVPAGCTLSVESNNSSIATASVTDSNKITVTGVKAGEATLTATIKLNAPACTLMEKAIKVTVLSNDKEPAVVVPADTDAKVDDTIKDESLKKTAESVATALKPSENSDGLTVQETVLNDAAHEVLVKNTVSADKGQAALEAASVTVGDGDAVSIVVQPYLDVTVTDVKKTGNDETQTTTLTLDITPMYKKVATTAAVASDPNEKIVLEGDGKNAVELDGEGGKLTVAEPTVVSVPLPAGVLNDSANAYIVHAKDNGRSYVYTGEVKNNVLTFTSEHGFSTFTISQENPAAAKIGDTGYLTLQAAVNEVEDGGTIVILKSDSATVSRTVSFTVKTAEGAAEGVTATITGGTRTTVTGSDDNGKYTCVYSSSSGHSSSGNSGSGSSTAYPVTVESATNGSVTTSLKSASKGTTVTVTTTPDKGWTLETLTVLDKDGKEVELTIVKLGEKYTFEMPSGKVEVKATFMEDNTMLNYFVDVSASDYFYDAVLWAAENGITTGVDDLHFAPDTACTRAQIVTFLWRAAGSPEPMSVSSFSDVASDSYYAKAVAWAIENGITNGTGDDKFSPDETCTRAQSVTFLARALNGKAAANAEFSDVPADSWYAEAVAWAAANGVTEGIGGGLFGSDSDCTRGQIVTFLFRAYVK